MELLLNGQRGKEKQKRGRPTGKNESGLKYKAFPFRRRALWRDKSPPVAILTAWGDDRSTFSMEGERNVHGTPWMLEPVAHCHIKTVDTHFELTHKCGDDGYLIS